MKQVLIIAAFLIFNFQFLIAQVGINTDNSNPDASAILDVKSTSKGFLYPRMTTTERDAIPNPSIGLTIFNLDDKCTDIYDGNNWMKDCPLMLVPDSLRMDTWTQKSGFGGMPINAAAGFSINGKGYIATGESGASFYSKDFWEYDPITNTWTQKADFPGTAREDAVGFSINGKGYIGTGFDNNGNLKKDFWEYDPSTDTWTQKADFGGTARGEAVGFSINGKGYIGTGTSSGNGSNNFWEYDPITDTWIQKADFPGTARGDAVGFSINDRGYIGTGRDASFNFIKDFWEYDPSTDTWTQKADLGGTARQDAVGFLINGKGYIGTGFDNNGNFKKDFWEYDPNTDTWIQKADFGGIARDRAVGFSINGKGYIGTGFDGNSETKDFWEYDPSSIIYQNTPPSIGFVINSTLNDSDNDTKIQVEESADEDVIRFDISGNELLSMKKGANSDDVLIETVNKNTFLGWRAGKDNSSGLDNTFVGFDAGHSGALNTMIGSLAGAKNQGNFNVMIGQNAGGDNVNGSNNVFIGPFAGFHETGSNKLYIDIFGSSTPLIYGEFDNDILKFNGNTEIQGSSGFPLIINSSVDDHVLRFKNADDTGWHMRLQGTDGKDLAFAETAQADNRMVLEAGGNIGIGTANPLRKLHIQTPTSDYGWLHTDGTTQLASFVGATAGQLGTISNHSLQFFTDRVGRVIITTDGNVGIGITSPNAELDVNGNIEYTGTIMDVSDRRLKENLLPISAVLTKLLQLQAYSYNMIDDEEEIREYGLLAQDVQKIFPEMVSHIDVEGEYLGLSYIQLIPILIEGMKEQQAIISRLEEQNQKQDKVIHTLNQAFETRLSQLEALLSEKEKTNTINSEK